MDKEILDLRAQNVPWAMISERVGKKKTTCHMRYVKLQEKAAEHEWTTENDTLLREAYKKSKSDIWNIVTTKMGVNCNWKVVENRVFELGKKGLKSG